MTAPHATGMEITISKTVSVVIAIGYAIALGVTMGFYAAGSVLITVVPLGLIWFPEVVGSITGYVGHGQTIDAETPPFIVSFLGWLFLVLIGIPIVAIALGYE
jgi:hypothetical protein